MVDHRIWASSPLAYPFILFDLQCRFLRRILQNGSPKTVQGSKVNFRFLRMNEDKVGGTIHAPSFRTELNAPKGNLAAVFGHLHSRSQIGVGKRDDDILSLTCNTLPLRRV